MTIWKDREGNRGQYTETINDVYLSYQPNDGGYGEARGFGDNIDSANPETAIVLYEKERLGGRRFLIYRGDWRKELETIFPDVEALKQHYREHGGHFWSDGLEEEEIIK